jgi:UTP--glucose-1-phosphate uridylyltransferase
VRGVIPKNVNCIYIRQSEPLGLGHAVLCARPVVGNEPFAVLLADDFMDSAPGHKPVLAQMTDLYAYEKCSVLAVQDVPRANTRQYGIVSASRLPPDLELVSWHRREAAAGRGAVDAGRGRPLRAVRLDF